MEELSVPFVYVRGGTSKALFFREDDIPPLGPRRDRFLLRMMGSPDPMQIDGMGGTHVVTSKVAIIKFSEREDADVDFTFAQVGITTSIVDYGGDCGNISSGVGPFAINEGWVKESRKGASVDEKVKTTEVRIYNTGTQKILISHVPIDLKTGRCVEAGDFAIAGCPGTGAPILMDYRNVVGATVNRGVIPTGRPVNQTIIQGRRIPFTICDVANTIIFARAEDFGLSGSEAPVDLDANLELIRRLRELRGKAAAMVGLCRNWTEIDQESPMIPMVALVSPPNNPGAHLQSRLFLDNKCHTSMAGTGAICAAACSRVPGSIVNHLLTPPAFEERILNIEHPMGIVSISVELQSIGLGDYPIPQFKSLSFIRTARRILDGRLYVPAEVKDDLIGSPA